MVPQQPVSNQNIEANQIGAYFGSNSLSNAIILAYSSSGKEIFRQSGESSILGEHHMQLLEQEISKLRDQALSTSENLNGMRIGEKAFRLNISHTDWPAMKIRHLVCS